MNNFKGYCEQTTLHGFGWIANTTSWIVWMFLLTAILTSIGFAAWDLQQLIVVYKSEPTTTVVSAQSNETMFFDGMTITAEFFQYQISDPLNSTEVTQSLSEALDSQISLFQDNATSIPQNVTNDLLVAILNMVRARQIALSAEIVNTYPGPHTPDNVSYAVYQYFNNHGISLNQLVRVTAVQLCRLMQMTVSTQTDDGLNEINVDMCQNDYFEFFDSKLVTGKDARGVISTGYLYAISFGTPQVNISTRNDPIILQLTPLPDAFTGDSVARPESALRSENQYLYIDLSGRSPQFLARDNMIDISFDSYIGACDTEILLSPSGAYSFLDLDRRPCSTLEENIKCQRMCLALEILETCKCWPTKYVRTKPMLYTNSTNCEELPLSQSQFIQSTDVNAFKQVKLPACNATNDTIRESVECISKCPATCQLVLYDKLKNVPICPYGSQLGSGSMGGNPWASKQQNINIYVDQFTFPVFKEQETMDWHVFISSFGGSIGVWLGGSFLAFVHIPVYLMTALFSIRQPRPKNVNPINENKCV